MRSQSSRTNHFSKNTSFLYAEGQANDRSTLIDKPFSPSTPNLPKRFTSSIPQFSRKKKGQTNQIYCLTRYTNLYILETEARRRRPVSMLNNPKQARKGNNLVQVESSLGWSLQSKGFPWDTFIRQTRKFGITFRFLLQRASCQAMYYIYIYIYIIYIYTVHFSICDVLRC